MCNFECMQYHKKNCSIFFVYKNIDTYKQKMRQNYLFILIHLRTEGSGKRRKVFSKILHINIKHNNLHLKI